MVKVTNCLTGKKEKINKKDFYLVDGSIEFFKDKISCYYSKLKNFYVNKKEFDKLFTTCEDCICYCFPTIGKSIYNYSTCELYVLKEYYDELIEELKIPHVAFVVKGGKGEKGEKGPYFFKLKNNEIVRSKTKNWYEFASSFFTIPPEWCLEELEEEDESIYF